MKEIDAELTEAVFKALEFACVAYEVGAYEVATQDFIKELTVQGYKIVEAAK